MITHFLEKRSGWFSSSYDTKFFTWSEITTESCNGMFIIKSGDYSASASYIYDMNTHILEAILRQHSKIYPEPPRLSSLLDER